MDILDKIVAYKRREIEAQKQVFGLDLLQDLCEDENRRTVSLSQRLRESSTGIIAEFKRKSPSKGWIKEDGDPETIPLKYAQNGASALSILTDEHFFGGSLGFIRQVRPKVELPILRKDFIIDPYQVYQARTVGADAILLIAAALPVAKCRELTRLAHDLSLEVLLEIHAESELDYVDDEVDMVGVNNRNLGTFHTDVENSFRIAEKLPDRAVRVSESGISNPETVKRLRACGFQGFLIGESFMKTSNPGATLHSFIHALQ